MAFFCCDAVATVRSFDSSIVFLEIVFGATARLRGEEAISIIISIIGMVV